MSRGDKDHASAIMSSPHILPISLGLFANLALNITLLSRFLALFGIVLSSLFCLSFCLSVCLCLSVSVSLSVSLNQPLCFLLLSPSRSAFLGCPLPSLPKDLVHA